MKLNEILSNYLRFEKDIKLIMKLTKIFMIPTSTKNDKTRSRKRSKGLGLGEAVIIFL